MSSEGKYGRGNLAEAMEGMFSLNERMMGDRRFDQSNKTAGAAAFAEAKESLLAIATGFQNEDASVFLLKDNTSEHYLLITVTHVFELPQEEGARPLLMVNYAYETAAGGPSSTSMRILQQALRSQRIQQLACDVPELDFLHKELLKNAAKLNPAFVAE